LGLRFKKIMILKCSLIYKIIVFIFPISVWQNLLN